MRRFQTLPEETQTALLFLWFAAFCSGGFGVALSWQVLGFLNFAFASFAIVSFLTSLQFFVQARLSESARENQEIREGEEGENAGNTRNTRNSENDEMDEVEGDNEAVDKTPAGRVAARSVFRADDHGANTTGYHRHEKPGETHGGFTSASSSASSSIPASHTSASSSIPAFPSATSVPSPFLSPLDEDALRERARFYKFVFGITRQGIRGEGAWEKQGLSRKTYRHWISRLESVGIVSPPREGAAREVRMSFEQALEVIARASGEPGYWQPVIARFDTTRPSSLYTGPQPPQPAQPQPSTYSHRLRLSQLSGQEE
jgi:hypothetical protein